MCSGAATGLQQGCNTPAIRLLRVNSGSVSFSMAGSAGVVACCFSRLAENFFLEV
jgi:hypothetical protein